MTARNSHFPWFFFWKVARLQAMTSIIMIVAVFLWDPQTAFTILPFVLASQIIFLLLFARLSRPLRMLLSRVSNIIQDELPYKKQLDLFYQRDEWAHIDAALSEADTRLKSQIRLIEGENRKFTTLLRSISNEILAVDRHRNVLFFNPRFERNFLADKEKLQTGGKLWSVLDSEVVQKLFEECLSTNQTQKLKGFALPISGESRFYNISVSPLPGANESAGGAVGVFTDVTEIKLSEQMRVDFVANVSHEIRTPLTSIKGFTQVLKANQSQLNEEIRGFVDRILHNTERMISLFNDILQLSVLESQNKIQFQRVNLAELLSNIEDNLSTIHAGKDFELVRKLEAREVHADPKLFEQVVMNLVDNACKYGRPPIKVQVHSEALVDRWRLTISDNGPGIAKEHQARIFERFYRIDASRDRGTGGTGLGLAIVKHIVLKHQGTIQVSSDGVAGTSFVIEWPILK